MLLNIKQLKTFHVRKMQRDLQVKPDLSYFFFFFTFYLLDTQKKIVEKIRSLNLIAHVLKIGLQTQHRTFK